MMHSLAENVNQYLIYDQKKNVYTVKLFMHKKKRACELIQKKHAPAENSKNVYTGDFFLHC